MKYALTIGINYENSPYALRGCINDSLHIRNFLKQLQYNRIRVITDRTRVKPTKTNIQRELQRFVRESYRCSEMLLHYAGHGTNVRDTSGDEDDQKDEVLVPSDFRQNGYITDDYINRVLQKLNPKCRVILLFDCCHSGTIADIQYQTQEPGKFTLKNQNKIQAPIVMYSGCTDPQQSADAYNINNQKKWSGAMTSSFIRALQPYIYKTQSVYQTLDNIRSFLKAKRYIQLPQLSVTNPNKLQLIGKNGFIQPARRRKSKWEIIQEIRRNRRERLRRRLERIRKRRESLSKRR